MALERRSSSLAEPWIQLRSLKPVVKDRAQLVRWHRSTLWKSLDFSLIKECTGVPKFIKVVKHSLNGSSPVVLRLTFKEEMRTATGKHRSPTLKHFQFMTLGITLDQPDGIDATLFKNLIEWADLDFKRIPCRSRVDLERCTR